jgi:hypothetical protein
VVTFLPVATIHRVATLKELPDYIADYADEVGGDADNITLDTLSALCRDVACLDTSVADVFGRVKPRTLVQGLLKGM